MLQRLKNLTYRLLRRSERYTGTDNVYAAKGGFFLTVAQFIGSLSSLLLAILYARHVSKDAYGTYQYLLAWGSMIAVSSLTGMSDALTSAVARGEDRTIGDAVRARLRTGVVGLAVAAALGGYYLFHGRKDLFFGFLIIGLCFPAQSALTSWADYAIGKKRFDIHAKTSVSITLVMAAVMTATVLLRPTMIALITSFSFGYLIANGVALAIVLKRLPPSGTPSKGLVRYGWKLTFIDVLGSVGNYFDKIIIFTLVGAQATAVYTFAIAVPEQIKGYMKNVYALALPKVSNRTLVEIRPAFFLKMAKMIAGVAVVTVVYILLAPWGYRLLFPAYAESIRYSQVFAISLVAIASVLPVAVFAGHQRFSENLRFQAGLSMTSVILLFILTWKWGLWGAVIARVVARLLGLAYSMLLVRGVFVSASQAPPPSHNPDSATPVVP